MNLAAPPEQSRGEVRSIRLLQLVCLFWLAELAAPLSLLQGHPSVGRLAAALAGAAVFVGGYLWMIFDNPLTRPDAWEPRAQHRARLWLPFGVLLALGTAMGGILGPAWLVLFIYAAVGAAFRLPPAHLGWLIGGLVVVYGAIGLAERQSLADVAQFALLIGGSGGGVAVVGYSIRTARELRVARAEVARLAVEAERLRFARDLHDLLGHDLAHIALKSEVGEAFIATAPEQAAAALHEVGEVARGALRTVRAAVAGYRQPTLTSELRAAAEILAAAGIAYHAEGAVPSLSPITEAVLAWAVREGVTNVVKHSRAHHCTIRLTCEGDHAGIAVSDDGRGVVAEGVEQPAPTPGSGGNGLRGLAERVAAIGGRCEAGPLPDGGFRIAVTLPGTQGDGVKRATREPTARGVARGDRP